MSEYISKEELIEGFKKAELSIDNIRMCTYPREEVMRIVYDTPPADVRENIHARWIPITDSYYEDGTVKESHWECSKCGSGKSGWGEFKFCPDCGADMREPKDIIHKAIDNTIFAEEAYPNIKEELHKAVDMAEPKGEKGTE